MMKNHSMGPRQRGRKSSTPHKHEGGKGKLLRRGKVKFDVSKDRGGSFNQLVIYEKEKGSREKRGDLRPVGKTRDKAIAKKQPRVLALADQRKKTEDGNIDRSEKKDLEEGKLLPLL